MATKHFLASRTLWFNTLVAAMAVLADNSGLLRGLLSDAGYLAVIVGIALANGVLRGITSTALSARGADDPGH